MVGVLEQVAVILALGVALKVLGDRIKFPSIVLFVLGGTMLASYGLVNMSGLQALPELVRTLALIIVVFSAGFYLNLGQVMKQSRTLLWLASFGVLITALIISGLTLYILPVSLLTAAFLGVLLCGTDPAAVASGLEKRHGKVLTILSAESLFNQPLTVILPLLLLDYIIRPETAWLNAPKLISLVVVGAGIGIVGAKAGEYALRAARRSHEEIVGLAIAIITYAVAENLFGSGILAVAVCSVLLTSTKIPEKKWLGMFHKELAFLFTIFVFMLLGAEFTFEELLFTKLEIFAIIVALITARFVMTLLILYKSDLRLKDQIRVGLIAPKGMAPAALAPLLLLYPLQIDPVTAMFIVKIVYLAIIVSTLFSLIAMKLLVGGETEREQIRKEVKEKREIRKAGIGPLKGPAPAGA